MDFELGRDTNGDECLEPEETELVVGNDCGAWFVRDELTGQEESDPQPPSGGQPSSRTFALVQSKALETCGDSNCNFPAPAEGVRKQEDEGVRGRRRTKGGGTVQEGRLATQKRLLSVMSMPTVSSGAGTLDRGPACSSGV